MVASGTTRPLDLFRQTPRIQITFNPQAVCDRQGIGERRIGHGFAAPQRRGAELLKGATVQSGYIFWLCRLVSHGSFVLSRAARRQALHCAPRGGNHYSTGEQARKRMVLVNLYKKKAPRPRRPKKHSGGAIATPLNNRWSVLVSCMSGLQSHGWRPFKLATNSVQLV